MPKVPSPAPLTIRPAVPEDADGITRVYLESAVYHADLDPESYWIPLADAISTRYREGRQHPPDAEAITLIAGLGGEIVGFVDVRLTQSPDPMHREMTYCHIVEIAVSLRHQRQGIGEQLLRAAEDWGREQGAEFALLEYLVANARAARWYERIGYRAASVNATRRL